MWKSTRNNAPLVTTAVLLAGVFGALLVTLPHSPINMSYAWPDGGVFLYVGQRILEGAVPYRDVWDHKPLLVYYLNALGLWLAQGAGGLTGARWGVWGIEFVAVVIATLLSLQVLRRAFGTALALLVTAIWLIAFFFIIEDGNLTETYALPLQFACLALAYEVETKRAGVYRRRGFFIGILLALIFFLKTNEIGIGLGIGALILIHAYRSRTWRRALADLVWIAGGFALITVLILGILVLQNNLFEFWRAVFVYNVIYSRQFEFWSSRFEALAAGYTFLVGTGLVVYALLGYVIGLNVLAFAREPLTPSLRALLELGAVALPIEVVLVTTTGRPFDHYFAALLYVLAIWAAYFFYVLFEAVSRMLAASTARARTLAVGSITLLLVLTLLPAVKQDVEWAQKLHNVEPPAIVQFLSEHTTTADTVLIWGHEARLLFFSGRRSPTRYVNASTFLQTPFVTIEMAEEYYRDIVTGNPAYIVDIIDKGLVNQTPVDTVYLRRRVGALQSRYKKYGRVGGWMVYERAASP